MERTELVVDFAHYTPLIKPTELLMGGVKLAIIKADGMFVENARKCASSGLPVCAYHWEDPTENNLEQVERTMSLIEQVPSTLGVMVDLEQWWDNWGEWWDAIYKRIAWNAVSRANPSHISAHAKKTFGLFSEKIHTFGYSSKWFVDSYISNHDDWLPNYKWVMAHYGNQPTASTNTSWDELSRNWLPDYEPLRPVVLSSEHVIGHQFTGDKFGLPGMYASEEKYARADVNVFNKDWLEKLMDNNFEEYEEEELKQINSQYNVVYPYGVNIRAGVGTHKSDIGDLSKGDLIEAFESDTDSYGNIWVHIRKINDDDFDGWVATTHSGSKLLDFIKDLEENGDDEISTSADIEKAVVYFSDGTSQTLWPQ